ncbi:MAG: hypothetical protein RPU13_13515 [Candidatus Sedimenticola sp. (ex Thyasira tokunagai)]
MKIENETGNLIYDTDNPLCSIEVVSCQGELFAFVVALDIGMIHCRLSIPHQKRYWGKFSWDDEAGSIRGILANGGKWPNLKAA